MGLLSASLIRGVKLQSYRRRTCNNHRATTTTRLSLVVVRLLTAFSVAAAWLLYLYSLRTEGRHTAPSNGFARRRSDSILLRRVRNARTLENQSSNVDNELGNRYNSHTQQSNRNGTTVTFISDLWREDTQDPDVQAAESRQSTSETGLHPADHGLGSGRSFPPTGMEVSESDPSSNQWEQGGNGLNVKSDTADCPLVVNFVAVSSHGDVVAVGSARNDECHDNVFFPYAFTTQETTWLQEQRRQPAPKSPNKVAAETDPHSHDTAASQSFQPKIWNQISVGHPPIITCQDDNTDAPIQARDNCGVTTATVTSSDSTPPPIGPSEFDIVGEGTGWQVEMMFSGRTLPIHRGTTWVDRQDQSPLEGFRGNATIIAPRGDCYRYTMSSDGSRSAAQNPTDDFSISCPPWRGDHASTPEHNDQVESVGQGAFLSSDPDHPFDIAGFGIAIGTNLLCSWSEDNDGTATCLGEGNIDDMSEHDVTLQNMEKLQQDVDTTVMGIAVALSNEHGSDLANDSENPISNVQANNENNKSGTTASPAHGEDPAKSHESSSSSHTSEHAAAIQSCGFEPTPNNSTPSGDDGFNSVHAMLATAKLQITVWLSDAWESLHSFFD
ncbi:expressed unknown protein [Seminavis robusta]|uniref:Uncharacterized protein n=1 Tax=Seminavis robusta TaxID=568900 RepID=A0A9N8HRK6_9STRA|nr:expressed unknown protein [Seminavis robusta]|eukprot:Sro1584_g284050.1 n/a (611) ;mRNA; f:24092-25924